MGAGKSRSSNIYANIGDNLLDIATRANARTEQELIDKGIFFDAFDDDTTREFNSITDSNSLNFDSSLEQMKQLKDELESKQVNVVLSTDTTYSKSGKKVKTSLYPTSDTALKMRNEVLGVANILIGKFNELGVSSSKPFTLEFSAKPKDNNMTAFFCETPGKNFIHIHFNPINSDSKFWSMTGKTKNGSQVSAVHELGHAFDSFTKGKVSSMIKGSTSVSTYGNSNYKEAFAESFVAYCYGLRPKESSDYHYSFVSAMYNSGYSSLYGCLRNTTIKKSKSSITTYKNNTVKQQTPTKITTNKANNFMSSSTSISGTIRGKNFSATITSGIKSKGYIERTIGNTKYRIDINTGTYTKV